MSTLTSPMRVSSSHQSHLLKTVVVAAGGVLAAWTIGGVLASANAVFDVGPSPQVATAASPVPIRASGIDESHQLSDLIAALEAEASRLETDFQRIDREAAKLVGPTDAQKRRQTKLPSEHDALVRYLNGCISLAENLGKSFGELVVSDEHVDLRERAVDARKNLQLLERMGGAGMLIRRQVRGWLDRDMQAVDALYVEWPLIYGAVRELIAAARMAERSPGDVNSVQQAHNAVLNAAGKRPKFADSQLGELCRKVHDVASRPN